MFLSLRIDQHQAVLALQSLAQKHDRIPNRYRRRQFASTQTELRRLEAEDWYQDLSDNAPRNNLEVLPMQGVHTTLVET